MRFSTLALGASLALCICGAAFARTPAQWAADLARQARAARAPGAAAAVVTADGPVWTGTFGVENLETGKPVTARTLFQIGSVTKNFTATLMMALKDEGRVDLDDRLGAHLPGAMAKTAVARVTLRQAAIHSGGLPKDPPNRVDVDGVMRPYSIAELHAAIPATKLEFAPGTSWRYANYGYALIGHVAERAAGEPYEAALRRRVLSPLGMTETRVALGPAERARLAVHYWPEDKSPLARPPWRFGEVAGFGGVTTTIGDLSRYLAFQISARPAAGMTLTRASMLQMRDPQIMFPNWKVGFGPGWFVRREADGGVIVFHPGEVDGHSGYIGFAPATGVGVAVAANLGGSAAPDIGDALLRAAIFDARQSRVWTEDEARALFSSQQWGDAEAALAAVTRTGADDPALWRRLGVARLELRDLAGADAAFAQVTGEGEGPGALAWRARIAAALGRNEDALARLSEARAAGFPVHTLRTAAEFTGMREDPRWLTATASPD